MIVALVSASVLLAAGPDLPSLPPIRREAQVTYLDRSGAVIGVRGGRYGPPVNLDKLPAHVPAAFVAIEDRRFYEHTGFDPVGIARAIVSDLSAGRAREGASTITQQLARNLYLSADQTVERKAREIVYAVQLERTYSKTQILALYLSRVYFGGGAYGLEAASQRYFNKPASRLSLREAATLAGVLKSPTNYNPADNPEAAAQRSRLVLAAMVETGAISRAQQAKALEQTIKAAKTAPTAPAQYFVDWVDGQARKLAGAPKQDLVVETTLDLTLETAAGAALRKTVAAHEKQGVGQAALVAVDGAGRVRAMVGGVDYARGPYNRAVDAHRQAGSAWKPFVYLAAMEAGRTPDTLVVDEPVTINGWSPRNYEPGFLGPLTLEQALARSVNTVAARLADEVGRPNVAAAARRAGIVSAVNTDPAMALGTTLVTPLEMTQAYAAFANGGDRVAAYGLERIRTVGGQVIYQRKPVAPAPAIGNPSLTELNQMLRTVMVSGTGVRAAVAGYDLGGKTGTTSDYKDAWFCGFTGGFASCVWMGRDDARPMVRVAGSGAPSEAWRSFMTTALKRTPVRAIPLGPPPPPALPPLDETVASEPTAPLSGPASLSPVQQSVRPPT